MAQTFLRFGMNLRYLLQIDNFTLYPRCMLDQQA